MRLKILVLYSAIVLSVGLAISVLLVMQLGDSQRPSAELRGSAQRAVQLARLQWQADQLQREAWLAARANAPWIAQVFTLGTGGARGDAATEAAGRLLDESVSAQDRGASPSLALFIDRDGVALGRNSVALMRGDPIAQRYPDQWRRIQAGLSASAVWFSAERQEQWFVSMVGVTNATGEWLGAIALGSPLDDEALGRVSELTSDLPLWAVALDEGRARLLSRSHGGQDLALDADLTQWLQSALTSPASPAAAQSAATRQVGDTLSLAAARLDPQLATIALLASARGRGPIATDRLLWSVWGVIGVALLIVGASAFLLAAYYSRAIGELEEGLLQVINGERDLRFDLDHPEFGGVAARINSLLDTAFGPPSSGESPDVLAESEVSSEAESKEV